MLSIWTSLKFIFWVKSIDLLNSLPNDKIVEVTKLKAFADDKLNIAKMMNSLFDRVENTVGKGENAGYQHFLLFLQCFPRVAKKCIPWVAKSRDCVVKG